MSGRYRFPRRCDKAPHAGRDAGSFYASPARRKARRAHFRTGSVRNGVREHTAPPGRRGETNKLIGKGGLSYSLP